MKQDLIWINKLKTAVLIKDIEQIRFLMDIFPSFENTYINTKKEVLYYLEKSKEILSNKNKQLNKNTTKV
jgi:hypothetical protein